MLKARGVSYLLVGQSIVATSEPFYDIVREFIDQLGLDLEIILNTDAVMVLARGIDKASGLKLLSPKWGWLPSASSPSATQKMTRSFSRHAVAASLSPTRFRC